jgi:hypothetical protein
MFNGFKRYLYFGGFVLLFLYFLPINSAKAEEVTTLKFFVGQETTQHASGDIVNMPFTIFIGDDITSVKSAQFEIKGISSPTASQVIDVSIDDGTFASPRVQTLILDASGKTTPFKILYDATSYMAITSPGEYSYTLNLRATGAAISLWSAKLIFTYAYTPTTGKYASSGYLISSIFDTQVTDGTALNSIMWQGNLPSGSHVKFQFASSNSSSGPWTYLGPSSSSATYYEPSGPDTPMEIDLTDHNSKRYLRYKTILNPTTNKSQTPRVDDVILNWSP